MPASSDREFPSLKVVPVDDIEVVPLGLLKQLKRADYDYRELVAAWSMFRGAPGNLLYVLVDPEHQIKGAFWLTYLPLNRTLVINFITLDRDIQDVRHKVLKGVIDPFIRKVKEQLQANKIWFLTKQPQAFERMGYRRSATVLMEE